MVSQGKTSLRLHIPSHTQSHYSHSHPGPPLPLLLTATEQRRWWPWEMKVHFTLGGKHGGICCLLFNTSPCPREAKLDCCSRREIREKFVFLSQDEEKENDDRFFFLFFSLSFTALIWQFLKLFLTHFLGQNFVPCGVKKHNVILLEIKVGVASYIPWSTASITVTSNMTSFFNLNYQLPNFKILKFLIGSIISGLIMINTDSHSSVTRHIPAESTRNLPPPLAASPSHFSTVSRFDFSHFLSSHRL